MRNTYALNCENRGKGEFLIFLFTFDALLLFFFANFSIGLYQII